MAGNIRKLLFFISKLWIFAMHMEGGWLIYTHIQYLLWILNRIRAYEVPKNILIFDPNSAMLHVVKYSNNKCSWRVAISYGLFRYVHLNK